MNDDSDVSIGARIMQIHDALTAGEQRLASVILELDGNFSGFTASELAARANVSNPTAARFFRRLGYENYQQARTHARDQASLGSPLVALQRRHRIGDVDYDLGRYAEHEILNLRRTMAEISGEKLHAAVQMLREARKIRIVAFRNSVLIALYLRAQLSLLHDNVQVLPQLGMAMGEDVATMGAEDLLVVVGMRRRPPVLTQLMRAALERNAKVLQLTHIGAPASPNPSVLTLRCVVDGAGIFDSYSTALCVANCLVSLLEQSMGPGVAERLANIEALRKDIDGIG
ncbi:MurR/RpiR family transcriptional regulator [Nguyenibacter vanlangensis]|uniref:MurR/RpiR family transcriptional regulator n=1 Tax=Nguyenibacter vanlangensis TaxID=1216886 RepID=A0A7Y7M8C4_9PROT|nr:MurR/RpiR family transcriptional regulator [Nguyenibacter vanlangensis]NVN12806.1 MurR/RpiR family transcriptional regulator [Nguyenibacter vanlangensis]